MSEAVSREQSGRVVGAIFVLSFALHVGLSAWLRLDAGMLDAWGIMMRTFPGGWDATSYPELGAFIINQDKLKWPLLVAWITLVLMHLTVAYGLPELWRKVRTKRSGE